MRKALAMIQDLLILGRTPEQIKIVSHIVRDGVWRDEVDEFFRGYDPKKYKLPPKTVTKPEPEEDDPLPPFEVPIEVPKPTARGRARPKATSKRRRPPRRARGW